ncbi:MAG: fused MFS/spermidine synthase [Elusimicrobia bacterium]|nr:fused MFS/spermidine synthase [Elusimicrobiota bacterium]
MTNEDLTPLQSEERARYFRAAAAVGLGGFAALIFEVGWTRALAFSLGSSIYAFTIMLFTFLAGLTLGSLAFGILDRGEKGDRLLFALAKSSLSPFSPKSNLFGLGLIEFAIAVCAFGSLFILGRMPYVFCRLYPVLSKSFHFFEAGLFALSCLVILLPTFLMGAALPWALCAAKGRGGEGARLGGLYASNTFGSILGSVLAGFILIPAMGVEKTLIIGILANTAAGLTAWSQNLKNIRRSALFALASLIIVMAAAFAPRWNKSVMASGMFIYADEHEDSRPWRKFVQAMEADELLYYQDGISATISVFEEDTGNRYLRTNGKTDASSSRDMETQLMTGYLPLLLHPNPKKAMVIGLGSGTSLGAIVQGATIERADCAEIEPAVAGAAKLFQKQNNNVLANPKTRLWFTDARHFLASVKNRYDVIASEPSNPWVAGVANLYSREAFGQVKKALAPGGIFCQWIHSYSMSEADFKMILATFRSVFPNPQLFNIGDVDFLILGSNGPWNIDYDQVAENLRRTPAALAALKPYGLDDPLTFLTKDFMLTSRDIEKYTAGITRLNTDDAPVLEFSAPKSLYVTDEQEKIVRSLKRRRSALHPDGLVNLPAGRVLGLKTKKAYKKPKTRNRN